MRGKYPDSSTCIDDPPRREVRDALVVLGSASWNQPSRLSQGKRGQNKHVSVALSWDFHLGSPLPVPIPHQTLPSARVQRQKPLLGRLWTNI